MWVGKWKQSVFVMDYSGTVWCLGDNGHGQLGVEGKEQIQEPSEITLKNMRLITCASSYTFAWNSSNECYYTGSYFDLNQQTTWKQMTDLSRVSIVKAESGWFHTLFLDSSQHLWVIGDNKYGQIGIEGLYSALKLTRSTFQEEVSHFACGTMNSYVIDSSGSLWVFGCNSHAQLGTGDFKDIKSPSKVQFPRKILSIHPGATFALLLDENHHVFSCGSSNTGHEMAVKEFRQLLEISLLNVIVGYNHSFLVDTNNQVWAFGMNYDGQLGNQLVHVKKPIRVPMFDSFPCLSAGRMMTLGIDSEGYVNGCGKIDGSQRQVLQRLPFPPVGSTTPKIKSSATNYEPELS